MRQYAAGIVLLIAGFAIINWAIIESEMNYHLNEIEVGHLLFAIYLLVFSSILTASGLYLIVDKLRK